jgi:hypothetical protein
MRIFACTRESYPLNGSSSYVLMHQSMALEELGHEVHLYNLDKHPLGLTDYVHAYDFHLAILDMELLQRQPLLRMLSRFRKGKRLKIVGMLYRLPPPPDPAWAAVDFAVTPWKGKTAAALSAKFDLRFLPLGYNARLHQRKTGPPPVAGIFAGNTAGEKHPEARERLEPLYRDGSVLCIGPDFEEKFMDPFLLGRAYAAARCSPNFHYSREKSEDCMLNERFWQTARCGIPVNDYVPLMDEILDATLVENFCFADKGAWQERVRLLASGSETVSPHLLQKLDEALSGHSYHDRMRQLLKWLQ